MTARSKTKKPQPPRAWWRKEFSELEQDKYYKWQLHCAQAKFRGESHSITFEQWSQIWTTDLWFSRGKQPMDICLSMIDPKVGWHLGNVEIITRAEQLRRQGFNRLGKKYKKKPL